MPHPRRLACLTLLLTACGPGDPDGTTSDASTAAPTSSSSDTTDTTAPTTTTTTASTSTTADPTTAPTTTTESTTTDPTTTATTGDPPVCGEQSCDAGQVCVLPCCGGPPPSCSEPDARGKCEDGQDPIPAGECQFNPCAGPLCCPPIGCTPDPPFCVAADALSCAGDSCTLDNCFGTLNGDTLDCACA